MHNLTTSFMGISLRNPIIVGASGLTANVRTIHKLEELGAGAIVVKSLFEEQIQAEESDFQQTLHSDDNRHPDMITMHPNIQHAGPTAHLMWVRETKRAVNIPVIASLNAVNHQTWLDYAKRLADTGVDGLECNFFASPADPEKTGGRIEDEQVEIVRQIKAAVTIPIAVKLSVFYSHPVNVISRMSEAGAAGVVLFNRLFEPDIDTNKEELISPLNLSYETDYRLPLRYAGLLSGTIASDICGSTGVSTAEDVIKMLLAGAAAVQMVSALYRHGIPHVRGVLANLASWMGQKGYENIAAFQGKLSQKNVRDSSAYTRAQYAKLLMNPAGIYAAYPEP